MKDSPGGETNVGWVEFLIILSPSPLSGGDLFAPRDGAEGWSWSSDAPGDIIGMSTNIAQLRLRGNCTRTSFSGFGCSLIASTATVLFDSDHIVTYFFSPFESHFIGLSCSPAKALYLSFFSLKISKKIHHGKNKSSRGNNDKLLLMT